jgi:hypothetical protein
MDEASGSNRYIAQKSGSFSANGGGTADYSVPQMWGAFFIGGAASNGREGN